MTDAKSIPFAIVDIERVPVQRYYDEEFCNLEKERLWSRVWQMACRLEQIPAIGDWIEYSNLGKSVIVVRTKDGIKAHHNVCRHRGVQIAQGYGNCRGKGFICPFHGWRWNMDGQNSFVYGRHLFSERALGEADLALKPCRVELWGGCAFINFDDDAVSLRESIGPRGRQLEKYDLDALRAEWWFATKLPANWKIAMEAFMEGYHVLRTHPQLHEATAAFFNSMYGQDTGGIGDPVNPNISARENVKGHFELLRSVSSGMGGVRLGMDVVSAGSLLDAELPDDPNQAIRAWYDMVAKRVTIDGRARGENTPDLSALAESDRLRGVEFIFPHYFLLQNLSSATFVAYRVRPIGPESCLFELWSLARFPNGEEPSPVFEPTILPYSSPEFPPIPQQDYANIPLQQLGLHAEGFEFMRLARDIEGLIGNYQQLIDGYLKGADRLKLAAAMAGLVNRFDSPIGDLGFVGSEHLT